MTERLEWHHSYLRIYFEEVIGVYRINNLDFAKRKQVLEGDIALQDMPRLQVMLVEGDRAANPIAVNFRLSGHSQQYHLPSLHLNIEANLLMVCQRCLEPMHVPIALRFDYLVSDEESATLDDDDEVDWVEQSENMDVHALVEDELLIALPIAPVHALACKQLVLESGEKPNPFSILKALKKD